MMKLFDRPRDHKTPEFGPELHEHLPELPEGVTIPDDISGIEFPVSTEPTHRQVRWLRWAAVGAVLAAGGLTFALTQRDGTTDTVEINASEPVSAAALIQESIDKALAERQTSVAEPVSAAALIQESIDKALAERQTSVAEPVSAAALIQESIDKALAEREQADVTP